MKKSLIALAVASVVSSSAFAATANVDVYGRLHFAIEDTNASGVDMDIKTNASRFGLKGSEDLGGGLKAIWQIEQQFDATSDDRVTRTGTFYGYTGVSVVDNAGAFGGAGLRNTFVGLSGGFGTVVLGRHDTPYKLSTTKYNVFADTIADYAATRLDGVALITGHSRASNVIAYLSPSFSGLSFQGAVVTSMDQLDADDTVDAISLAAGYANGPLTVDFAWEDIGSTNPNAEREAFKLGAGYSFGAAKIGVVYEDVDMSGTGVDRDSLFLVGSYTMGAIVLKGQYGQADVGPRDMNAWALGADYNLSKRTTAFVVYGNGDNDNNTSTSNNGDVSGWNIGMTHNF